MTNRKAKDFLKEQYPKLHGFIEHTLVAEMAIKLAKEYHTQQMENVGVSDRTIKRICEHEECNKEFTVNMSLFGDRSKANATMQDCPHCKKRNDIWIELS